VTTGNIMKVGLDAHEDGVYFQIAAVEKKSGETLRAVVDWFIQWAEMDGGLDFESYDVAKVSVNDACNFLKIHDINQMARNSAAWMIRTIRNNGFASGLNEWGRVTLNEYETQGDMDFIYGYGKSHNILIHRMLNALVAQIFEDHEIPVEIVTVKMSEYFDWLGKKNQRHSQANLTVFASEMVSVRSQ